MLNFTERPRSFCFDPASLTNQTEGVTVMNPNIGTVVVDCDNTIVPTRELEINTLREVSRFLGLRVPSGRECLEIWPLDRATILNILWPGQVGLREFNQAEMELKLLDKWEVNPFRGAAAALVVLRSRYCLMLATNRQEYSLDILLEKAGIPRSMFDFIQPIEAAPAPKPDPRFFDKIREIAKGQIAYVGDSIHDYGSTKSAKDIYGGPIMFVAVLTGTTTRTEFHTAGLGREFIAKSLADVPELLRELEAVLV